MHLGASIDAPFYKKRGGILSERREMQMLRKDVNQRGTMRI